MANKKNNKSAETKQKKTVTTKSTTKPAAKAPKAPKTAAPKVEAPEVEATTNTAPVQTAPENHAGTLVNAMNGHLHGGLDANRRMDLITNIGVFFHNDPRARQNLGDEVCDAMDDIARIGIVCAIADEAVNGDGIFAAKLKATEYPALVVAANKMGIKLPSLKALPVNGDGVVEVKSTEAEVDEGVAAKLAEEHKIEEAGEKGQIELDAKKVAHMGEEDLIKALKYYMVTGPKKSSPFDMLTTVVDFMKDYRNELASQAENKDEAIAKLESRTMYEWLNDAFSYVSPTMLMSGIGRGMKELVIKEGSPLSAFIILRNALTDKNTHTAVWEDQDLADATRAIVEFIANNEIKSSEALLTTLVKDDENYEKEKTRLESIIATNKQVIDYLNNISFDIIENMEQGNKTERTARGRIWKMYYPECDAAELPRFKNLEENIAQRGGIILNLFRAPGDKNQNYSDTNLTEIEKYTLEEYTELKKKQATAAKEESKND